MTNEELSKSVDEALHDVEDPEAGVNIVDLGLVYGISCRSDAGDVNVSMTLTTPACPAGDMIVEGVERRLLRVPGVSHVEVHLVFEPRWTPDRITPEGRAALGW